VIESVVVADIGSVLTKTSLLASVDGHLRVLAASQVASTVTLPRPDVMSGLREGIRQLEAFSGRRLLDRDFPLNPSQSDGNGVDHFIATSSAGQFLTLLVLVADQGTPVSRAVTTTLSRVLSIPVLQEVLALGENSPLTAAEALRWQSTPVDAILLVPPEKTSKGNTNRINDMVQFLTSTTRRHGASRLPLFFLGDQQRLESLNLLASEDLAWQPLATPGELLASTLATLAQHLGVTYHNAQQRLVPGLQPLAEYLAVPLQPSSQALGMAAEFLARSHSYTLVANVGATTTATVSSDGATLEWGICAGLGTGYGATSLIDAVGINEVMRWLPYQTTPDHVMEAIFNRSIRPASLSTTIDELQLDYALATEAIRVALSPRDRAATFAKLDTVVAAGGVFRNAPSRAHVVFSLLSALQPVGRTLLLLDQFGILEPLGTLSQHEPAVVRHLLHHEGLETLGTSICVGGKGKEGDPAVQVTVLDGRDAGHARTVHLGSMLVLPVPTGTSITLELKPLGRFTIGLRPGEGARAEALEGGTVGVIIDARPRPLTLPARVSERIARLTQWLDALHAY